MPPRAQEPRAKRPQEAPPEALRHPERSKKPLGPGTAKNQEPRGPGRKPSEEDPSATSKGRCGKGASKSGRDQEGPPGSGFAAKFVEALRECGSAMCHGQPRAQG